MQSERPPSSIGSKACGSCHKRKIRCDLQTGEFPCSNCKALGQECRPLPDQSSGSPAKSRRRDSTWSSEAAAPIQEDVPLEEPPNGRPSTLAGNHTSPGSYLGRAEYISGIVPIDEEDAKKYGAGRETDVPELDMRFLGELRAFDLPARSVREGLISHFMERCHPWMPIIEKSDLEKTDSFDPSFLLLQAVFVAGSRVSMAPQAQSTGHAFYRRAKALYYSGAEKDPLSVIRAICILQWWNPSGPEHVSMDASSFWLHMGVALAHQVGLHREPNPKQSDASLRRRLWWTLFTRDCMISMSHGRPRAINPIDTDVRPLSLSDFPYSSSNPNALKLANHFIAYVEICAILGDLTESSVRQNLSRSLRLSIETRLATWIRSLPPSLQLRNEIGLTPYDFLNRQLHVPYFTALTILFRPTSPFSSPSAISLLSSSYVAGIFEDFLARGEIPMLASTYVFHMLTAAIAQLACMRYMTLWAKAEPELEILNQGLAEMSKRYPTALGAQRVVKDVTRAVRKQEPHSGPLQISFSIDQLQYFEPVGSELCGKWSLVLEGSRDGSRVANQRQIHQQNHVQAEYSQPTTINNTKSPSHPSHTDISQQSINLNTDPTLTDRNHTSSKQITFQDPNQTFGSMSMAPSAWDGGISTSDMLGMISAGVYGGDNGVASDTIGNWMLNDWMTDLGW